MKELRGSATGVVASPAAACVALLADVEGYQRWYPEVVRKVRVLQRDDQQRPIEVHTTLHIELGPLGKDFPLAMTVAVDPRRGVTLTRVPEDASDEERFEVHWLVEGDGPTRIDLQLEAALSVPRLLPLGGAGNTLAEEFLAAAVRALE